MSGLGCRQVHRGMGWDEAGCGQTHGEMGVGLGLGVDRHREGWGWDWGVDRHTEGWGWGVDRHTEGWGWDWGVDTHPEGWGNTQLNDFFSWPQTLISSTVCQRRHRNSRIRGTRQAGLERPLSYNKLKRVYCKEFSQVFMVLSSKVSSVGRKQG